MTYAAWEALGSGGVELPSAVAVVEQLRAVKDEEELEAIRAAARVTASRTTGSPGRRSSASPRRSSPGASARRSTRPGASEPAFATIAGAGPNGALPHHHPGERRIGEGETPDRRHGRR